MEVGVTRYISRLHSVGDACRVQDAEPAKLAGFLAESSLQAQSRHFVVKSVAIYYLKTS
jgi:hypothetical protein